MNPKLDLSIENPLRLNAKALISTLKETIKELDTELIVHVGLPTEYKTDFSNYDEFMAKNAKLGRPHFPTYIPVKILKRGESLAHIFIANTYGDNDEILGIKNCEELAEALNKLEDQLKTYKNKSTSPDSLISSKVQTQTSKII